MQHIQGVKTGCADDISRDNFDDLIGVKLEELAKEAFTRMDVHLDLNMTMTRASDGLQQVEYLKDLADIYTRPEKSLNPIVVNQERWKRHKNYLWHKDCIATPNERIPVLVKWTHESCGHVGADRMLTLFKKWFHITWTNENVRKTLEPIVDRCPCSFGKPHDLRDRGLYSTLPIPQCLRRLKLHGQNHTKSTQCGQCKKIVFHRLCFLETEYYSKESFFLTICAILCLLSDNRNQKKTYYFS